MRKKKKSVQLTNYLERKTETVRHLLERNLSRDELEVFCEYEAARQVHRLAQDGFFPHASSEQLKKIEEDLNRAYRRLFWFRPRTQWDRFIAHLDELENKER